VSRRILLVDDDASVLAIAARTLNGYDVSIAHSGTEALAAARSGPFDLVITDYMMPVMTGDELLGRLRERQPDLKALILTGHAEILSCENPGWWKAEPHLGKPFTTDALRRAVAAIVGAV
jgi:two-component system response regulator (stage 0 sporulation protein F)